MPSDPDRVLRNLDSFDELKFIMLESSSAEDLFCKHYLDCELYPYEILIHKLLRGRFHSHDDFWQFIAENKLEWITDNGIIRLAEPSKDRPFSPNNEIMLPAGFGKTTIVVFNAVMECCENPNSRNIYIFKNASEGHSASKAIRQWLTMPEIVKDFGQMKPTSKNVSWADTSFSVEQREIADIRDCFSFYGTNSDDALGKRSDTLVMDDIETTDTARTQDSCEKLLEWVQTGPMTSPRPRWKKNHKGVVAIPQHIRWPRHRLYWGINHLGTIFHPKGVHSYFADHPNFNCLRIDCYRDEACKQSIAPEMMSIEDLEREKRSGILVFNKRYRNIAYDPAEMAFQELWLKGGKDTQTGITYPGCCDEKHSIGEIPDGAEVFVGFDPASGSKSRFAAYSAYIAIAIIDQEAWVVDFSKHQEDFSRMLDRLLDGNPEYGIEGYLQKYQAKYAVVEKNAFGTWLIANDRTKPFCDRGLIVPSYTGTQKVDPEIGVFGMASMIQDGRLHIPYREPSDKLKAATLLADMCLFPKSGTDLVMALWLAMRGMKTKAKFKTGYRGALRRGNKPYLYRSN